MAERALEDLKNVDAMDKLSVEVEFPIANDRLKRESAEAKQQITGVGQTAESTAEKVNTRINALMEKEIDNSNQLGKSLQSLKIQLQSYQAVAEKTLDPAVLENYNRKIAETATEMARLRAMGTGGSFDDVHSGAQSSFIGLAADQQAQILKYTELNTEIRRVALAQRELNNSLESGQLETAEYNNATAALTARERELRSEIAALNKEMNVGGGAIATQTRQWNGLQNSINQISRELPAFTYSAQTGFMAISNNIPILFDEIGRLRKENEELSASGKKGVPIWKQLASSLFSWNTLMSVGVTLLTVYGKEIGNWIVSLFKGADALDKVKASQDTLNSALQGNEFKKATIAVSELRINLDLAKKGMASKKGVVDQYNESIGKVAGQVTTLDEVEGKLVDNADAYVKAMLYKAAATLALEEASKKAYEAQLEAQKSAEEFANAGDKAVANLAATGGLVGSQYGVSTFDSQAYSELIRRDGEKRKQARIQQLEDEQKAQLDIAADFQKKAAEQAKKMGGLLLSDPKKEAEEAKKLLEQQKREQDALLKQRQRLMDKLAAIDAEYARKSFTKDEEELQALKDKFSKIRTEVQRFNADAKNKNVRIELKSLDDAQARAEEDLIYRQETDKLKKQLEEQKKVYSEYEKYKNQFGKKAADERFKDEKKGFDTYTEFLNAKAKENAGAIAAAMMGTATGGQSERVKLLLNEGIDENRAQEELWNEQLAGLLSYEKGRAKIIEDYNVLRNKLIKQGKTEEAYVLDEQFKNELNQYDNTNIQKLDSYKELFEGIERLTDAGARRVIANAQSMLKALLAAGKISPELAKEIDLKLADTQQALDDRLPNRLNDLAQGLGQIVDLVSTIDSGFGGVLGTVTSIVGASAQVFGNLKGLKDGLLNFRQNSTDGGGGILGTISAIAGVAGPASAIVGAVSGVAKGVVGFFKARKEAAEAARKAVTDYYSSIAAGEREYDKLLRQRELTAVQQGKTSYKAIIDQLELLKKQAPEIEEAYNKIYAALQGQEYVSGIGYKHGTWFRKAKTWDVMSSLAGADYDRLEQLYTQGALKDQAKADFEALRSLREELESAGLDVADLQRQLNEMLTGTSATGLSDSLTQLFQNGKLAAADLGKSFEEIMRNAIANTFKYKYLEEQMSPFYDALSDLMQSGTPTEAQINQLRDQYTKIGQEAAKQWENLEKVTGINLGNSDNSSAGKIQQSITEQSASELIGLQRASYDLDKKQLNTAEQVLSVNKQLYEATMQGIRNLAAIEKNTSDGVAELKNAVTELKAINKNTSGSGYDKGF